MGLLATWNGSHPNFQVQPLFGHRHPPHPHVDNAFAPNLRRGCADAGHESSGTPLWSGDGLPWYVSCSSVHLSLSAANNFFAAGLGYIKYLAPPEWALRWVESKFNLLSILPHYVSIDQKTYGRFGVLPTNNRTGGSAATELVGSTQRLGP